MSIFGRRKDATPAASAPAAATAPAAPQVPAPGTVIPVGAPVSGTALPLAEVTDQVFSSGALGGGAAVRPSAGRVIAPVDGVLVSVMPHAYGLRGDCGVELLVHVGIDTVNLEGAHFTPAVTQGQRVARGDVLLEVDLGGVAAAGYDTTTVVLVTNSPTFAEVTAPVTGDVAAGGTLFTVVA